MSKSPAPPAESNGGGSEVASLLVAVRAVLRDRPFAEAATAVLGACQRILGAEAGLVVVCKAGGKDLQVALVEPGSLQLDAAAGLPAPLRRLCVRAAKVGRPVFANDLPKGAAERPALGRRTVPGSALLAPMIIAGEVAGFVGVIDKLGGFSAADAELAEAFAEMAAAALRKSRTVGGQASVAAENAVLFEQMQASTVRMQLLSRRIVEAQESERRHIARELHDQAFQSLAALRYGLRLLEREIDLGGSVTARVAELMQRTDAVIDGLRRLAADLRPASLDHLGLEAALRQYSRAVGSQFGLVVRFKARGFGSERLPTAVESALYRVVQEAMNNVVRHARATRVDVLVERRGDRVMVMIEDDGVGFEPDRVQGGDHFGLLGLRARAESLGGTLTVESAPGAGSTIVVEVANADPHPDR